MVQEYVFQSHSWEKNTELEKIRKGGAFFRYPLPQGEMNLVTGAFSSHPSSWISWTMLLGVQWWLSKHGASKHYRHASSLEQGLWKEQFPELPCQLVDTCYCQKQPQLWLWGGCGGMSASWLWLSPHFNPFTDLGLPIYMHVHESAVWACGCLSLWSAKARNRKNKWMFSLFWEGLLTVF